MIVLSGRLAAAFRFLTILPLPGSWGTSTDALAGSTLFFPLIGLFIGMIVGPLAWLLGLVLPGQVVAVLTTFLLLAISGGFHLDGLADTADGFFSARPREEMLVIMRDSATGAMGVIALVLLLALKITCLSALTPHLLAVILLMPLAGRTAIVLMMALLPYARPEGGLASLFYSRRSRGVALAAVVFFFLVCWLIARGTGLAAACVVVLFVGLFSLYCRHKINGATGDTLGAACELSETVFALVCTALLAVHP